MGCQVGIWTGRRREAQQRLQVVGPRGFMWVNLRWWTEGPGTRSLGVGIPQSSLVPGTLLAAPVGGRRSLQGRGQATPDSGHWSGFQNVPQGLSGSVDSERPGSQEAFKNGRLKGGCALGSPWCLKPGRTVFPSPRLTDHVWRRRSRTSGVPSGRDILKSQEAVLTPAPAPARMLPRPLGTRSRARPLCTPSLLPAWP